MTTHTPPGDQPPARLKHPCETRVVTLLAFACSEGHLTCTPCRATYVETFKPAQPFDFVAHMLLLSQFDVCKLIGIGIEMWVVSPCGC
jgi:hypothetical protein